MSVDAAWAQAGRRAVADGRAPSLSSWVNEALARQAEHDAGLAALDALLADIEDEHGEITPGDIADAEHRVRTQGVIVRGRRGAA